MDNISTTTNCTAVCYYLAFVHWRFSNSHLSNNTAASRKQQNRFISEKYQH